MNPWHPIVGNTRIDAEGHVLQENMRERIFLGRDDVYKKQISSSDSHRPPAWLLPQLISQPQL